MTGFTTITKSDCSNEYSQSSFGQDKNIEYLVIVVWKRMESRISQPCRGYVSVHCILLRMEECSVKYIYSSESWGQ